MFTPANLLLKRSLRYVVTWLLALVLPIQGMAVGITTVLGPAHVHRPVAASINVAVLRNASASPVQETHILPFLGHFHDTASPQRHYHAHADGSVVREAGDGLLNGTDADDGTSANASLASVLGVISEPLAWYPPAASGSVGPCTPWSAVAGFSVPPERPPRLA